jgi:flagellar protein FliO/FliZ
MQSVIALFAVLGLLWAAARFAKRHGAPGATTAILKAVSSVAVGTRERVVIVEVEGQWLVLGVAPGRVSPITVLPKGEVPAAQQPSFPDWLSKALKK